MQGQLFSKEFLLRGIFSPFSVNSTINEAQTEQLIIEYVLRVLYGLSEDDTAYILDTFPIVREQDEAAFGLFRTKGDVLAQLTRIRAGTLQIAARKRH